MKMQQVLRSEAQLVQQQQLLLVVALRLCIPSTSLAKRR
jgi:hypothetical protein